MEDREDNVQKRIDINEMERTPGWKLVEERLREEMAVLERELKIEIEGKSAQEIGENYIKCIQGINGLKKVFEIIGELKRE